MNFIEFQVLTNGSKSSIFDVKRYGFDIYRYVGYKLNIYLDVNYSLISWSNCGSPERVSS
jgi:hypothetical protein